MGFYLPSEVSRLVLSYLLDHDLQDTSAQFLEECPFLQELRQVAVEEEGGPVELQFSQLSSSPLLLYSTAFGSLVGWDMRKPGDALRFCFDLLWVLCF